MQSRQLLMQFWSSFYTVANCDHRTERAVGKTDGHNMSTPARRSVLLEDDCLSIYPLSMLRNVVTPEYVGHREIGAISGVLGPFSVAFMLLQKINQNLMLTAVLRWQV